MLRAFSGSCLSLEDMDTLRYPSLVKQPHVLGPGVDFFTLDGEPVRPQPGAHTLQKVFSGSALDLNAMNGDLLSEDEALQPNSSHPTFQQQHGLPGTTVSTILCHLSSETEKERAKSVRNKTYVLVIGGIGYISSHVVKKLLDAGYAVRVTVDDTLNQQQQMDLYYMGTNSDQRLTIIEADMTSSASLRDAMRGCKYVIHCGCPLSPATKDPVKLHVDAIRALYDAIRLVTKSTIKRVILTGAASSVLNITDPDPPSGFFDGSSWNTVATATTDPIPYARICFEKEAWRMQKLIGVELVVILPSITIGPSLTEEISEAMMRIKGIATASPKFPYAPKLYWNYVDVRDVAEAHVRALECHGVKDQRVIVSNGCYSYAQLGEMIKEAYPHLTPPTKTANTLMTLLLGATQSEAKIGYLWRSVGVQKHLDTRLATAELDLKFTPMQETMRACMDQWIRSGEVPAPHAPRAEGSSELFGGKIRTSLLIGVTVAAVFFIAKRKTMR